MTSSWFTSIPQALGFYEEEGLEVEVQGLEGGGLSIQTLVAGRSQLATQSTEVIYTTVETGEPVKGIMCQIPGTFIGIAVLRDSDVETEADLREALRGETVGVNAVGSGPEMKIRAVLEGLGLHPGEDVELLAVGTEAPALKALQNGDVAALGLWSMVYASFEEMGADLRIFQPDPLPRLGFEHATVATQRTIKERPEMLTAYCRAITKSLLFLNEASHEEIVKLHYNEHPVTKPQGVSDEEATASGVNVLESLLPYMELDQQLRDGHAVGDIDDKRINSVAALLEDGGIIKEARPPDAYFTREFLVTTNDIDKDAIVQKAREFTA